LSSRSVKLSECERRVCVSMFIAPSVIQQPVQLSDIIAPQVQSVIQWTQSYIHTIFSQLLSLISLLLRYSQSYH